MDVFALQRAEKELAKNPNDKRCYAQVVRLRQTVTGTHFRGRNKKGLIIINEDEGCNDPYKTRSGKYYYDYFGHYDPEKYKQEMRDYKSGKRKSRPNGRKWCKI